MPTVQITPSSSELLQNVADTLGKAKKVVMITGAGISTNSGIPVSDEECCSNQQTLTHSRISALNMASTISSRHNLIMQRDRVVLVGMTRPSTTRTT